MRTSGAAGVAAVAKDLEGTWTLEHKAGYMRAGIMTMAVPASASEQLVLVIWDGKLYAKDADGTREMELMPAEEPPWRFQEQPGTAGVGPVLTDQDIRALVGCDASELPRLIAEEVHDLGDEENQRTGIFVNEGVREAYDCEGTMNVTLRLIPMTSSSMFGILHFAGSATGKTQLSGRDLRAAFAMVRSVIMTKN